MIFNSPHSNYSIPPLQVSSFQRSAFPQNSFDSNQRPYENMKSFNEFHQKPYECNKSFHESAQRPKSYMKQNYQRPNEFTNQKTFYEIDQNHCAHQQKLHNMIAATLSEAQKSQIKLEEQRSIPRQFIQNESPVRFTSFIKRKPFSEVQNHRFDDSDYNYRSKDYFTNYKKKIDDVRNNTNVSEFIANIPTNNQQPDYDTIVSRTYHDAPKMDFNERRRNFLLNRDFPNNLNNDYCMKKRNKSTFMTSVHDNRKSFFNPYLEEKEMLPNRFTDYQQAKETPEYKNYGKNMNISNIHHISHKENNYKMDLSGTTFRNPYLDIQKNEDLTNYTIKKNHDIYENETPTNIYQKKVTPPYPSIGNAVNPYQQNDYYQQIQSPPPKIKIIPPTNFTNFETNSPKHNNINNDISTRPILMTPLNNYNNNNNINNYNNNNNNNNNYNNNNNNNYNNNNNNNYNNDIINNNNYKYSSISNNKINNQTLNHLSPNYNQSPYQKLSFNNSNQKNKPVQAKSKIKLASLPLLVQDFVILMEYNREIERAKNLLKTNGGLTLQGIYKIMKKPPNSIIEMNDFILIFETLKLECSEESLVDIFKRFAKTDTLRLKFYDIVEIFCTSSNENNEFLDDELTTKNKEIINNYFKLLIKREKEHKKFKLSIGHNQNVLELFKDIDDGKKGYIAQEDIKKFLHSFEIFANQLEVMSIMRIYNKSNSGRINYNEFLNEINS